VCLCVCCPLLLKFDAVFFLVGGGLWFGVEVSRVEFFSCYFLSSSLYMMSLLLKLSSTYLVCNSGVCDFFC